MLLLIIFTLFGVVAFLFVVIFEPYSSGDRQLVLRNLAKLFGLFIVLAVALFGLSFFIADFLHVYAPGSRLYGLLNWTTNKGALVGMLGIAAGLLLAVWTSDRSRLRVARSALRRRRLKRRIAYEQSALMGLMVVGILSALLSTPLKRLLDRLESVSTPMAEFRLRGAGAEVRAPWSQPKDQGSKLFQSEPSVFLSKAAVLAGYMESENSVAMALHSEAKSTDKSATASDLRRIPQEVIDNFAMYVEPLLRCSWALYQPSREISALPVRGLINPLRVLAREGASSGDRPLFERLVFESLLVYAYVAELARFTSLAPDKNCRRLLVQLQDPSLISILKNCHSNLSAISCETTEARHDLDKLVDRVILLFQQFETSRHPDLTLLLAQVLAIDGQQLSGMIELDQWLREAVARAGQYERRASGQENLLPRESAAALKVQATFVRYQIIPIRDELLQFLSQQISTAADADKESLTLAYVRHVRQQLAAIESLVGPYDWYDYYSDDECIEPAPTTIHDQINQNLMTRHVSHRNNLAYRLSVLREFPGVHSEEARQIVEELNSYTIACVNANRPDPNLDNILETVGSVHLQYVAAHGDDTPLSAGSVEDLLARAENAFRLCRDRTRESYVAQGGAPDDSTLPIGIYLQTASERELHTRCLLGLERVAELRNELL